MMRAAVIFGALLFGLALLAWSGWPLGVNRYPRGGTPIAEVRITRDQDGAPLVEARGRGDLFFGQGYATAADRLFQLDWSRRGLYGHRAEVAGRSHLVSDFRARALDLERISRDVLAGLDSTDQAACRSYAAGVNAWLAEHPNRLPREFRLLRYAPAAWRPEDCVAIWRGMALTLTDLTDDLEAPATGEARLAVTGLGSNGWAVAGNRTASGFPLLAGDPHLEMTIPGALHRVALTDDNVAFAGFALPGVPGLAFGRSRQFAWTVTAFEGDNSDVFRFPLEPGTSGTYRTPSGPRRVRTFRPVVWVRLWRGVTAPVFWQPLERVDFGPVIERTSHEIRVLRWAGGGPLPGEALLTVKVLDVGGIAEMRALLARQGLPDVNIVYADQAGHIGHFVAGMIPRRKPHFGVRDGMDEELAWNGYVPASELPSEVDPPEGYVYSANGPPRQVDGPYLGRGWPTVREARLRELLVEADTLRWEDFARWQEDVWVPAARAELPSRLANVVVDSLTASGLRGLEQLRAWDGRATVSSSGATVFRAWASFGPGAAGLNQATSWLERRLGADPREWRWGRVHVARLSHALTGVDSTLAPALFERAGDRGTLNVAGYAGFDTTRWPPMVSRHGPALRFVADLSPGGATHGVLLPGVSGDPDSPHYLDQLEAWRSGRLRRLPGPGEPFDGPTELLPGRAQGARSSGR